MILFYLFYLLFYLFTVKQTICLLNVPLHVSRTGIVLNNNEVLLVSPVGTKNSGRRDVVSASVDHVTTNGLLSDLSAGTDG